MATKKKKALPKKAPAKKPVAKKAPAKKAPAKKAPAKQTAKGGYVMRPLIPGMFGGPDPVAIHFDGDKRILQARTEGMRELGQTIELSFRVRQPVDRSWIVEQMQTFGRYSQGSGRALKPDDNIAFQSPPIPTHPQWKGYVLTPDPDHKGHLALILVGDDELALARDGKTKELVAKLGLVNDLTRPPLGTADVINDVVAIPVKTATNKQATTIAIPRDTTFVRLAEKQLVSVDLRALVDLPVEIIALHKNDLATIDLQPLAKIATLKTLSLDNNPLTSIDLQPLAGLRNFAQLTLNHTPQRGPIDLSPLAKTAIELLNLCSTGIPSVDLRPLAGTPIERLYIAEDQLTQIDLAPLAKCKKLRQLSLQKNPLTTLDLAPLAACKQLERLEIGGTAITAIDLAPLAGLAELEELYLYENRLATLDLSPLAKATKLDNLDLETNGFKELDLTPLLDLPIRRFVVSPDVKLSARGKKRDLRFTRAEIRWY